MNTKELQNKSKYLSLLLRHKPENENLNIDEYGWVPIHEILDALKIYPHELSHIVEFNDKKRFICDEGLTKIRATQGHSFPVKKLIEPLDPPLNLYHGTSIENQENIYKNGITKMNRQDVHLSEDKETAISVGMRHAKRGDKLWVCTISSKLMNFDGYLFYKTENGVWLTDHVPTKYIINGGNG
jgi:putative RNA 2'-phosphotransferase